MKGRVQVIHEDQDRGLENGDSRRKNTMSKKGNTQGYTEIGDETRTRWGQGEDEDEAGMRRGRGRGEDEDEARTRTRRGR